MRTLSFGQAQVHVFPDGGSLCRGAVDQFRLAARAAIDAQGRFTVALSGGSTPRAIYAQLAKEQRDADRLPWDKIHAFFGDERHVPPDHPESNFRMAHEALLGRVSIPANNVHRVRTELAPPRAAAEYEAEIRSILGVMPGGIPRFDLILLGLGTDGHTASLFPDTAALTEKRALVCANWVEKLHTHRITFTFPLLNSAGSILFIVGGADKAGILRQVLRHDASEPIYPAQLVQPSSGSLLWIVDEAAFGSVISNQ
jgi:6-phosphogluconolactonase